MHWFSLGTAVRLEIIVIKKLKKNKLGLWGTYKESWEICSVNPENQMVNRVCWVNLGSGWWIKAY